MSGISVVKKRAPEEIEAAVNFLKENHPDLLEELRQTGKAYVIAREHSPTDFMDPTEEEEKISDTYHSAKWKLRFALEDGGLASKDSTMDSLDLLHDVDGYLLENDWREDF